MRSEPGDRRRELRADCTRCAGLCCVAMGFTASADFAIDKPAGQPCPNLRSDFGCAVHGELRTLGFPGCAAYDCLGAGQQVIQVTFGGRDWRRDPDLAGPMLDAFAIMRGLHELLWYLTEALTLPAARPVYPQLRAMHRDTDRMARLGADELAALDLDTHREQANRPLRRAAELARTAETSHGARYRGADLVGARLRGADLRGADLRGAVLLGADLRRAWLRAADLTGADLRGADVRGSDLGGALFVLQPQLDVATGDAATTVPPTLRRPAHWLARDPRPRSRLSRADPTRFASTRPWLPEGVFEQGGGRDGCGGT